MQNFNYVPPRSEIGGLATEAATVLVGAGIFGEEIASHLPLDSKNHKKKHNFFQKLKEFVLASVPFSNELANVLAHLKEDKNWVLAWLYQHSPKGIIPSLSKYTIDFFALLAMVGNGINEFNEYLEKGASKTVASIMGVWEASLYLLFSYIIPSFSIPAIMTSLGKNFKFLDKPFGRFITGVAIGIGSLELGVRLCTKFIKPLIEKFAFFIDTQIQKQDSSEKYA